MAIIEQRDQTVGKVTELRLGPNPRRAILSNSSVTRVGKRELKPGTFQLPIA
jgi:hypothetical protein